MKVTEVHQLLEKCKAASDPMLGEFIDSPDTDTMIVRGNCRIFVNALTPNRIQTLAENYLAAIDILKEVAEITSDVDEQGYNYDWMQHVDSFTFQPVRLFLKIVGIDASEGKV